MSCYFIILFRQHNRVTILPIAENLSDYNVSLFEIRKYSCTHRLHKNFLDMGQKFCKKTALLNGAATELRIRLYCERRGHYRYRHRLFKKALYPDCIVCRKISKPRRRPNAVISITSENNYRYNLPRSV